MKSNSAIADWKESPGDVLDSVNEQLKDFGVKLVLQDTGGDWYEWHLESEPKEIYIICSYDNEQGGDINATAYTSLMALKSDRVDWAPYKDELMNWDGKDTFEWEDEDGIELIQIWKSKVKT